MLPRWLDDEFHGRGAVVVAIGVLVFALLGWIGWSVLHTSVQPVTLAAARSKPSLSAPLTGQPSSEPAMPAASSQQPPFPPCPHQVVEVTGLDGIVERGCVSTTRTSQNGSVRSYSVEAEGVSSWRLVVDVGAGSVLSARLSRPALGAAAAAMYVCDVPDCQGVRLGEADAAGARLLRLDEARLHALPLGQVWQRQAPSWKHSETAVAESASAASTPVLPSVRLRAALRTVPDSQSPGLACTVGGVRIVEGGRGESDFCPLGGAGFQLADDGRPQFEFRDLEGRSLVVALAEHGAVAQVTFGTLQCKTSACGGLTVQAQGDPANPTAARSFTFAGTRLTGGPASGAAATLSGSLTMPSQE